MSEIRDSIAKLFKVFSGKPNSARINLYAERLQNEKPEHVARACDKMIDTRKTLPAIADIRELVTFFSAQERSANSSEPVLSDEQLEEKRSQALDLCAGLHREKSILDVFVEDLKQMGCVGEDRAAKLLYLAIIARVFERPVNVIVKGPSSAGKSNTAKKVIEFFPASAVLDMAGMSARYLAYADETFAHRMLYIWEASGLGEDAEAMLRVLLSEGCITWRTVVDQVGVTLHKPGPTGLILTTTAIRVHEENETRLLSVPVDDTPEQTKRVMQSIAKQETSSEIELTRWHGLANWLALGETRVFVPFAKSLADLIPPLAVRLRRDFSALLGLIQAHALLHRATREVDEHGRVLATLDDYDAVRTLVADIIAEQVEQVVPETIRQTVAAVSAAILKKNPEPGAFDTFTVTPKEIAAALHLDKSTASRRIKAAIEDGYLEDVSKGDRRPRIKLGAPVPVDDSFLPTREEVATHVADEAIESDQGSDEPAFTNGHDANDPFADPSESEPDDELLF